MALFVAVATWLLPATLEVHSQWFPGDVASASSSETVQPRGLLASFQDAFCNSTSGMAGTLGAHVDSAASHETESHSAPVVSDVGLAGGTEHGETEPAGGHVEGEGEGEAVEAHGHGHEESSAVDEAVAAMTLGSVAFQMSLFYLLNYRDQEIKRYAHSIIGQTISIFCAVLIFHAMHAVMGRLFESLVSTDWPQLLNMAFLVVFFGFTQATVYASFFCQRSSMSSMGKMVSTRDGTISDEGDRFQATSTVIRAELSKKRSIEDNVLDASAYGTLLAQISGAAAMRAFGSVQYQAHVQANLVKLWAVSWIAFLFFIILISVCGKMRRHLIMQDGIVDPREYQYVSIIQDCENEVMAMTLGFLWAVAARSCITGSMPEMLIPETASGHDAIDHHGHGMVPSLQMFSLGFCCAVISVFANIQLYGALDNTVDEETLKSNVGARAVRLLVLSISLVFAWCICFGSHLVAVHLGWFKEGLALRLFLALFQSLSAFACIIMLDFVSDLFSAARFEKAVVMLINGLGVSVGLLWEHLFHQCVSICVGFMVKDEHIFKGSKDPDVWALALSSIIVLMVLPAFRFYLVPRIYKLIEEHDERLSRDEEKFRQQTEERDRNSYIQGSTGQAPAIDIGEGAMYMFQEPYSAVEWSAQRR